MPIILIIEDNADLAAGIRHNLQIEGHDVHVASDGVAGIEAARKIQPDLVILDVMLPRADGFEVLETLRSEGMTQPIIMLTARGAETDKVRAFRLDADQYVTKPFGLLELIERVNAQLRRAQKRNAQENEIAVGDVRIDVAARKVTRADQEVALTPRAFDLLVALTKLNGKVVSREELLQSVWGHRGSVVTRTVDSHISELRQKLEADPDNPRHILTVYKRGYRFQV